MQSKWIGLVLGVAGVLLWFAPLAYVELPMLDTVASQTAANAGGLGYVLLIAAIAYAICSWREQHVLRIVAAATSLLISAVFMFQVGRSAAWGLMLLVLVSGAGIVLAAKDLLAVKDYPTAKASR